MVLGIVSLVLICLCCGVISWLPSIVGLILGIVPRAKGNKTGMALAGIILNSIALLFTIFMVILIVLGSANYPYYGNSSFWDGTYL